MPSESVLECSKNIKDCNLTIAFAESATAGRLAAEFSLAPESGKILKGGLVCYDASLKKDLLSVSPETIETYTPESGEVTEEAAKGLQHLIKADIHVAITGLTTPGGSETPEKPVGTIFVHVFVKNMSFSKRMSFTGDAVEIVMHAVDGTAALISNAVTIYRAKFEAS